MLKTPISDIFYMIYEFLTLTDYNFICHLNFIILYFLSKITINMKHTDYFFIHLLKYVSNIFHFSK
jgi:hypothetical protein